MIRRKKKAKKEEIVLSVSDKEEKVIDEIVVEEDRSEEILQEISESRSEEKSEENASVNSDEAKAEAEAGAEASSEEDSSSAKKDGDEVIFAEEKKVSKKKIFIIAAAVIVCLAGIITFVAKNIHTGDEGKVYVESVSVLAGLGSANGVSNRYTGVVEAQDSWKITLEADMSVEKCFVKVGQEVKKGAKLFTYNTEELQLNLDKKQLELDTMQSENRQLTKDIATYQSDLKDATASEKIELQTQILTAQTTIKKNEYSIKSAKKELETIKKNIKDATVTSKMDGVVKSINEKVGAMSGGEDEAYDEYGGAEDDGSVYMTILAIGDYRVKGKAAETNMSSLNEGDAVIVRSRVDEATWTGRISKINTDATADKEEGSSNDVDEYSENSGDSASTYNFYVELESDEGLLMGQHVFVEPDLGQDEEREGIWISSAYVLVEEETYYVWADNGRERLEKRSVEVGEYDEELDQYQILSGLAPEDYIACDDFDLKAGMKTTKVDPYSEENGEDEEGDDEEMEGSGDEFDEFDEEGLDDVDEKYIEDYEGDLSDEEISDEEVPYDEAPEDIE